MAAMVQPFKGTVNDITVGSATGAVNTKSHCTSRTQYMYPLSNQRVPNTEIILEVISQKIQIVYSSGDTTNK